MTFFKISNIITMSRAEVYFEIFYKKYIIIFGESISII